MVRRSVYSAAADESEPRGDARGRWGDGEAGGGGGGVRMRYVWKGGSEDTSDFVSAART